MRFSVDLMTVDMSLIIIFLCINFKIYIIKPLSSPLFSFSEGNLNYLSLIIQIVSQSYIYSASFFSFYIFQYMSETLLELEKTVRNKADNISLTLGLILGYRFQVEISALKLYSQVIWYRIISGTHCLGGFLFVTIF